MKTYEITSKTSGDKLLVFVPYALKDAFKAVFKTAKWDRYEKGWAVKNTTANKNKLQKFIESSALHSAIEKLKLEDETEAKADEIEKIIEDMTENLDELVSYEVKRLRDLEKRLSEMQKEIEENEKLVALKKAIDEKEKEIEYIEDEYKKAKAENDSARTKAAEVIARIVDENEIEKYIDAVEACEREYRSKGFVYAKTKAKVDKTKLREFRDELADFGILSLGLSDLIDININRLDRERLDDARDIYDIEAI